MNRYLLAAAVLAVCAACNGERTIGKTPSDCQTNADCNQGSVCVDGKCVSVCTSNENCGLNATCKAGTCVAAACGDGLREAQEQCDEGDLNSDSGACTIGCRGAICGDHLRYAALELCDDGNLTDGDGCDGNCTPTGCGNGVITAPETCDDSNLTDGDGCDSNCTRTGCGNGIVTGAEVCDNSNLTDGDDCDSNCTLIGCGNGIVTAGEDCDNGPLNSDLMADACRTTCTDAGCGDAVIDYREQCDDGPENDDASGRCRLSCVSPRCRDHIIDPGEECDDGNDVDGDGCTNVCTVAECGDDVIQSNEQCDDANGVNGDDCDNNCTSPACGNGIVAGAEQCDDGNTTDDVDCDSDCTLPVCGDGHTNVPFGEACDSSGVNAAQCDSDCTLPVCGDGIINAFALETCDDGDTQDDIACDGDCTHAECGDGHINLSAGEVCDGGVGCSPQCQDVACGDGSVDGSEQCDNGASNGIHAACLPTCRWNVPGDGYLLVGGEACDDGNPLNTDNCVGSALAFCGDGHIRTGLETCDDGNIVNGDGCSAGCTLLEYATGALPATCSVGATDNDGDGVCSNTDNCPVLSNPSQRDANNNHIGDACEWVDLARPYAVEQAYASAGAQAGDDFGKAMAVGYFDDDDYADLAVGAPGEDGCGFVFVYYGGPYGLLNGTYFSQDSAGVLGACAGDDVRGDGDRWGAALAAGDFNNDTFDDLAVGAPGEVLGSGASGKQAGAVTVMFGGADGLSGTGSMLLKQTSPALGTDEEGDQFGFALAAGNFDGLGGFDLAIGAPKEVLGTQGAENDDSAAGYEAGAVFIVFGENAAGSNLLTTGMLIDQNIHSDEFDNLNGDGDQFGFAVAAGKVDGDAEWDLAVGAPGDDVWDAAGTLIPAAGSVWVFMMAPRIGNVVGFMVHQEIRSSSASGSALLGNVETGDEFGSSVAIGRLRGSNGWLVVGAPREAWANTRSGAVMAFRSKISMSTSIPTANPHDAYDAYDQYGQTSLSLGGSNEAGDDFGTSVAIAAAGGGRDGQVIVGIPGESRGSDPKSGVLALLDLDTGTGDFYDQEDSGLEVNEAGDLYGRTLAVGDFDHDGAEDIAIGAPGEAPGLDNDAAADAGGIVYVLPGLGGRRITQGPIIGEVTSDSARIWVRSNKPAYFTVAYKEKTATTGFTQSYGVFLRGNEDYTGSITLRGLLANTTYQYRPLLNVLQAPAPGPKELSFNTLAAPTSADASFKFAFGADLNAREQDLWLVSQLHNEPGLDLTLLIGDLMYADSPHQPPNSYAHYFRKYRENFSEPSLSGLLSRIPTLMMWDDHEIKNDWSTRAAAPYNYAAGAYRGYVGKHNPYPLRAGEFYYTHTSSRVGFFVLDTRKNRSLNTDTDGAAKTMLGASQKQALKDWLLTSTATFKFLVSSVPWHEHGTTGSDSWTGFLTERNELFNFIRDNQVEGVVLLSGDQHWAGVFKIPGYDNLYDFSPTPLGTTNRSLPSGLSVGGNTLYLYNDGPVYGLFTANTSVTPATFKFEVKGKDVVLWCGKFSRAGLGVSAPTNCQ